MTYKDLHLRLLEHRFLDGVVLLVNLFCLIIPSLVLIPWRILAHTADFPFFYAAAKLILQGQASSIYDFNAINRLISQLVPELSGRANVFITFPAFAWVFCPFALVPYKSAFIVCTILSYLALIASFVMLSNAFSLSRMQRLWLALIIGFFGPLSEALRLGQLSCFLLLGLSLLAYGMKRKKPWLTVIGQSILWLKPHLLLPFLAFEIGSKSFAVPLRTCLIALAGLTFTLVLGGTDLLYKYVHLISAMQIWVIPAAQPTLQGQLIKLLVPSQWAINISWIVYLSFLFASFYAGRTLKDHRESFDYLFGVILPWTLCLVPHLHNYDILLLAANAARAAKVFKFSKTAGLYANCLNYLNIFAVFLFVLPVYVFVHYYYILRNSSINPFFWTLFFMGLLQLILLRRANAKHLRDNS